MVPIPKRRPTPNILVTGTPGVGKSRLCQTLARLTSMKWLNVSEIAKDHGFIESYDNEYQCPVIDEDKLLDYLEEQVADGGAVVDYHSSEFFPERWFDVVFVLRANNTTLYERLVNRGYGGKKLEDNISFEIFQSALEEARNAYSPDIVVEMESNTKEHMDDNVTTIIGWIDWWKTNGDIS